MDFESRMENSVENGEHFVHTGIEYCPEMDKNWTAFFGTFSCSRNKRLLNVRVLNYLDSRLIAGKASKRIYKNKGVLLNPDTIL